MSEELREHVVNRSEWAPGPWDGEPDRWEDRELGFPVLAVRNDYGVWCGYVGVPPGHPWHGIDYNEVDLDAHGGLTYAGLCNRVICHIPRSGEPAAVWWLGFDCAHAGDLSPRDTTPRMRKLRAELAKEYGDHRRDDVYRDLAYVQKQTRAMAAAAAAAAR